MCFAYHNVLKRCPVQTLLLVPCIIAHSCVWEHIDDCSCVLWTGQCMSNIWVSTTCVFLSWQCLSNINTVKRTVEHTATKDVILVAKARCQAHAGFWQQRKQAIGRAESKLCSVLQAGEIEPTEVNTSSPYTVPPAPEAPSEDTASIESVGTAEVVPDVAEPAPPPPPPAISSGVYGTFLPVTDTSPVSPASQVAYGKCDCMTSMNHTSCCGTNSQLWFDVFACLLCVMWAVWSTRQTLALLPWISLVEVGLVLQK